MRLINDIRLAGLEKISREIEMPTMPFLFRKYNLIGRRYAAKLHSIGFDVGEGGDVFILQMKYGSSHGDVEPDFDGLCRRYSCVIDVAKMAEYSDLERQDFFAESITKMMLDASSKEKLETDKVRLVSALILKEREELDIILAFSENDNWSVRVEYMISDCSVLTVTVLNKGSSREIGILELQLDEYQDAQNLVKAVKIKKSSLSVVTKPGLIAEHTLRRYAERLATLGFVCSKNYFEIPLPQA